MTRQQLLAGLTTLAVVCGAGSTAWADPYADEAVSLSRVTSGHTATGTRITTSFDNNDNGGDATGAPDLAPSNIKPALTILGFDAKSTADTADDVGGVLALRFTDNVCGDGAGADIKVHESGSDESAMVEVSDDDGQSFKMVGHVGPHNGFQLDVNGKVSRFNQIRLTAESHVGTTNTAGIDLDAVECMHAAAPLPDPTPDTAKAEPDGCDLVGSSRWYSRGRQVRPLDAGIDVEDVTIASDETSIEVTLNLCGELSNRTVYAVYFDYTDRTNLDDDSLDDGPDTLDGNLRCRRTYDHTAYYYRGRERGGIFTQTEDPNQLVLSVDYADLDRGDGVAEGSEVLLWVETRGRGYIRDHVPTTEVGDRCSRPQIEKEVFRVTLGSIGDAGGDPSGNPGGDPDGPPQ